MAGPMRSCPYLTPISTQTDFLKSVPFQPRLSPQTANGHNFKSGILEKPPQGQSRLKENHMTIKTYRWLASICFPLGFVSIIVSILVWMIQGGDPAHGERFGIFIGLWAPTFFILTDRFERTVQYMEKAEQPTPFARTIAEQT
jgi:hypothetical protein